ncbi:Uncharacterised protein [Mycobacterium tuberculosis]|nr:Uncharacterised protein [Mycobacterium tuberculosis]
MIGLREDSTPAPEFAVRLPNTIACTTTAVPPWSSRP